MARISTERGSYGIALQAAASKVDTVIVELLLKIGAEINAQGGSEGRTPLHLAVEARAIPVVTQLLDKGALTNTYDFGDLTPLQLAVKKGDSQIALLLLPKGTDSPCLVKASEWRKIIPDSQGYLEMATEKSMTITRRFENEIKDRSYPFFQNVEELADRFDDLMATGINSKRIW